MWERMSWEPVAAEVPKASDLRRKETWETWYGISMLVLSPNEASGTRAISMASLDLRFIIWGSGDPGHQSERVCHLSF
jgi:hypothetical protein